MPSTEDGDCASRGLATGEPLAGTASRIRRWLLIEQPGRWGHDALVESELPRAVGLAMKRATREHGMRVLLIKRRDRPAPARRRCFAAYTGPEDRWLAAFGVDDPRELLDLALPPGPEVGASVEGPLFVTCTHGKHDPCCSRYGIPPARALGACGDAWEATHVGGDRFAGNVVAFPHGLYFGRVRGHEALALAEAYRAGRISMPHYRGRSCDPPPVQVAEHAIREREGLDGVDDLRLVRSSRTEDGHEITFRTAAGKERTVRIAATREDPRLLTCKAAVPHARVAHRPGSHSFPGG